MMTKIYDNYANAEMLNELYNLGFRYITDGDYKIAEGTDPWSGMPNTTHNLYAFDNKEEAEAFAVKQIWVFNPNVHAKVKEIPAHTETWEEREAREERKAAEKKAKREAKEARKAAEAGMTVEEYRKEKARKAKIKKIKGEIEGLENEIARLEKELKNKKAYLEKLKG